MATRDLFAAVDRPPEVAPPRLEATDFRTRWSQLSALVLERWGQQKLWHLEMKLSLMHKLIEASRRASNSAWEVALDELREARTCPFDFSAWMAAAVERAIETERYQPPEHRADDGAVSGRRNRAYQRIARRAGPGEP